MKEITHIVIVGMGALGMLFGSILMEQFPEEKESHLDRISHPHYNRNQQGSSR